MQTNSSTHSSRSFRWQFILSAALMLLFTGCRSMATIAKVHRAALFLATVILQGLFSAGPFLNDPFAGEMYYRFYKHHPTERLIGQPESLARNS